jgi:hypothetical protein
MDDLLEIEQRYKDLSTKKLLDMAKEIHLLRPEVVPILKKELANRGQSYVFETSPVDPSICDETETLDLSGLSYLDIQKLVTMRLQLGEDIETIKLFLNDHGVDINDVIEKELENQEDFNLHQNLFFQNNDRIEPVDGDISNDIENSSKSQKSNLGWIFFFMLLFILFLFALAVTKTDGGKTGVYTLMVILLLIKVVIRIRKD